MFNSIKKKKLNNVGAVSMLFVLLSLTTIMFISGAIGLINKTTAINELQGIIDLAGVSALRYGTNEGEWRDEQFVVSESAVKTKFRQTLAQNINYGSNKLINSYNIKTLNFYPPNDPKLKSLGIPSDQRDQYFLEVVVSAKFKNANFLDTLTYSALSYYDFFNTNSNVISIEEGIPNDGYYEVIVRSVSRIVLR